MIREQILIPKRRLGRIRYENVEWYCTLSKQLTLELDDSVEDARRPADGILTALVKARSAVASAPTSVPRIIAATYLHIMLR